MFILVCDLDNTLAMHPDDPKRTDHSNCQNDIVNEDVKLFLNVIRNDEINCKEIIFLTKRHEKFKQQTLEFLNNNFSFNFELIMRTDIDPNNSPEFKKKKLQEIRSRNKIIICIEDDERVLKMMSEIEGVLTYHPDSIKNLIQHKVLKGMK